MKNNLLSKSAAGMALGLTLFSAGSLTPAFAEGGGTGTGCGADGCSLGQQNIRWESWSSDAGKTNAYAKFKADMDSRGNGNNTNPAIIDARVNGDGEFAGKPFNVPGGVDTCNASEYVWATTFYDTSISAGWITATGATHGPDWWGVGTIESPGAIHGLAPSPEVLQQLKAWDAAHGNKIDKNPGYVIFCSGSFGPPPDRTWSTSTPTSKVTTDALTATHLYSCNVEVKPQILVGGKDPIGKNNLHAQAGTAKITNFGKLYDSINLKLKDPTFKWTPATIANYRNQLAAAVAKDKAAGCTSVQLDAANKAGMAEGGVLNLYQQSQLATIKLNTSTTLTTVKVCNYVQKWNSTTNAYDPATSTCTTTQSSTTSGAGSIAQDTLKNTAFWQLLSVHCNLTQLKALLAATPGASTIATGDSTQGTSAMVQSPIYKVQPQMLDFGDQWNSNKAKAASGKLAFYNKECPVDCTPDKKNAGASTANGGKSNVNGTTVSKVNKGKYGAVSGGVNTNKFEFFRDNTAHQLNVDVWFPRSTGVVSYNGAAPLSTTVTRWAQGTPSIDGTSGGTFKMSTTNGKTNLFTDNVAAKPNKNWDVQTWNNPTSVSMLGLERSFTVQADWASDANRPQVLNFKWEYAPTVSTQLPATLGFDYNGNLVKGNTTTVAAPVQAKCVAAFGTLQATSQPVATDGTLVKTPAGPTLTAADWNNPNSLFVNFVRSTTE